MSTHCKCVQCRDVRFGYLGTKSLKFGYFELCLVTLLKNKSLTNPILWLPQSEFLFENSHEYFKKYGVLDRFGYFDADLVTFQDKIWSLPSPPSDIPADK